MEHFKKCGVKYEPSVHPKAAIYLDLLPMINSGRVRLLGNKRLISQLMGLERNTSRGGKDNIDHARGGHDDLSNAAAGALLAATARKPKVRVGAIDVHGFVHYRDKEPSQRVRVQWYTPEQARELKEKGLW